MRAGKSDPGDPRDRPRSLRWAGHWEKGADYDGDGIADLIRHESYTQLPTNLRALGRSQLPTAAAISGRDGRLLWTADINSGVASDNPSSYKIDTLGGRGSDFDLDRDGTPDLIAEKSGLPRVGTAHFLDLPLVAISGKTGAALDFGDRGHGA